MNMSSRYIISLIPVFVNWATTGFSSFENVRGALASPKGRHANSHRVSPQMNRRNFW